MRERTLVVLLVLLLCYCCTVVQIEASTLTATCQINSYVLNDVTESPRISLKLTLNGAYNVTGTGTSTYVNHLLYMFRAYNTSNGAHIGLTGITMTTGNDNTILTFTSQNHVCDIGPSVTLTYSEVPYQPLLFSINATRITTLTTVCTPVKMNTIYTGVLQQGEGTVVIKAARGIRNCANTTDFRLPAWWFTAIGGHTGPYRFCNTTSSPYLLPLDDDATMWWCYINTTFATGQAYTVTTFYQVADNRICDSWDNHTITARNDADSTESFQLMYALPTDISTLTPGYAYDWNGDGLYEHVRMTLSFNVLASNFSVYKTHVVTANNWILANCTTRIASAVPQHVDYLCDQPFQITRDNGFYAMLVGANFYWNISKDGFSFQANYGAGAVTDFSTVSSYGALTLGNRDRSYYAWQTGDRCVSIAFKNFYVGSLGTDQVVIYDGSGAVSTIVGVYRNSPWSTTFCGNRLIDFTGSSVVAYVFPQTIPGNSAAPLALVQLLEVQSGPEKGTGSCSLSDLDNSGMTSYWIGWGITILLVVTGIGLAIYFMFFHRGSGYVSAR